jgi:serine/threonine protein kinase
MKADIWACGVILFIMLAGFPPFQKPDLSDWWFNKLVNGKHALFWQAHSRSAYFSDQTKDFLNKILNPDPDKRISIADMKKHPWWKGTTITNVALVSELQRRKNTVDTVKSKEKEKKKKGKGKGKCSRRSI